MNCCCGHDANYHKGGPDLTKVELERMRFLAGDGGMCRAVVDGKRCDCFNFCDCYTVEAELEEVTLP